jgi:hypothetical protein
MMSWLVLQTAFVYCWYNYSHVCEGLSAATKLNTARLINEDIMYTTECTGDCNMIEEITEQMLD